MSKRKSNSWFDALNESGIESKSARDAMAVKGYLDTGNYALNWAVSGRLLGGYPLGHCGEIFGDPSTGKSFLAARAIAMCQRAGGVALLDDAEGAYNAEHSSRLGVDVDALAYKKSRTVKEHLATTQAFVKAVPATGVEVAILVLDSIAQLSTEHELEVGLDKRDMTKAAELKAFYRIVGGDLFDLPVVHLATNHTIANIGDMFNKRTTGGGGGPKFTATWRLDMRATSKIHQGQSKDVVGTICRAVVAKNRITSPFKEVSIAIPFNQPISKASGLIPLLVNLGLVEERGNFIFKDGQKLGRAYKTKDKFLEQDEQGEQILDTFPEILEEADAAIKAGTAKRLTSESSQESEADEDEE